MKAIQQTRTEAIALVVGVLTDGQRSDRYLRRADHGHYYASPDKTFLTEDGPDTPPYVFIPHANEPMSDENLDDWADALLTELDEQLD